MSWESVATVDEVNGEIVRQALADAGIEARLSPVRPRGTVQVPPLVPRSLVEVEVDSSHRDEAEALLAQLEEGAEAAALEQAEQAVVPEEMQAREPLWRRALRWLFGGSQDTRSG